MVRKEDCYGRMLNEKFSKRTCSLRRSVDVIPTYSSHDNVDLCQQSNAKPSKSIKKGMDCNSIFTSVTNLNLGNSFLCTKFRQV
jgi:hypothetical protein